MKDLAQTLENIHIRARTLFADGYAYIYHGGSRFVVWDESHGTFEDVDYLVDIEAGTCRCRDEENGTIIACPSMLNYGTCKHLLAAQQTAEAQAYRQNHPVEYCWHGLGVGDELQVAA